MNNVAPVGMSQRAGYLGAVSHHRFIRQPSGADRVAKRLAFDEFHNYVELALGFAHVVYRADIRVGESGSRTRLAQQELTGFPAKGLAEEFQRHVALQYLIARAIDHSHAPFSEL